MPRPKARQRRRASANDVVDDRALLTKVRVRSRSTSVIQTGRLWHNRFGLGEALLGPLSHRGLARPRASLEWERERLFRPPRSGHVARVTATDATLPPVWGQPSGWGQSYPRWTVGRDRITMALTDQLVELPMHSRGDAKNVGRYSPERQMARVRLSADRAEFASAHPPRCGPEESSSLNCLAPENRDAPPLPSTPHSRGSDL